MTRAAIIQQRLQQQFISHYTHATPEALVSHMGAIQAQDFAGAKWSVALRIPGCTEADVDQAIAARKIIRTWPMRGTLHFVAAADIRWMLDLMAAKIITASAGRRRQLELDEQTLIQSGKLIEKALRDDRQLTRSELYELLEQHKISTGGQRGIHILSYLAHKGLICFATHTGKQPGFALLDEWAPSAQKPDRTTSLATIALRYFNSHGPATLRDFAWWTGLTLTDARNGLAMVAGQLQKMTLDGTDYYAAAGLDGDASPKSVYLLPGFDEYMLGYTDRSLILDKIHAPKIVPGNNGMFMPTIIVKGKVAGLWKRTIGRKEVSIDLMPFEPLNATTHKLAMAAAHNYGRYLGLPVKTALKAGG